MPARGSAEGRPRLAARSCVDVLRQTGRVARSPAQLARRIAVTAAGVAILAVGVVLLIAPGPGVLVVALGFFVLGLEYEWANRYFERARRAGVELAERAVARPASTVLSVLGCLAIVAAGIVWALVDSLPGSSWWTGGSVIAGGVIALATIVVSVLHARSRPASHNGTKSGTESDTVSSSRTPR